MKTTFTFSFATIITLTVLSFSFCGSQSANNKNRSMNDKGFAVVELFTSEGCSSCPPADEAMIRLAKEFPEHVYFLGYHVDYWDYIGWKDEFDSPEYTKRQNRYAEVFKLEGIYTPQAIVNGEKELVGSRESQLRNLIEDKLKTEAPSSIELNSKADANTITVSYKTTNTDKTLLNIALVQKMATSNVKRGENNGRKLNHINIVRDLKTVAVDKNANASIDFKIPSGLAANDVKLIAFVQDKDNLKIKGAVESSVQ